jgi:hypothetical protein
MPRFDPLVQLLDVLQPSLAMYLADSGIWTYPGDEEIKLALADLVGDHRSLVERSAVMLEDLENSGLTGDLLTQMVFRGAAASRIPPAQRVALPDEKVAKAWGYLRK